MGRLVIVALMLFGAISLAIASSYTGRMAQIVQIGKRTSLCFVDGNFNGAPSLCPYANSMIYSVDNTTPGCNTLIAKVLTNGREPGTAGDGVCAPNDMYRNAQGEGMTSYSP